jgi:hypothetical protein
LDNAKKRSEIVGIAAVESEAVCSNGSISLYYRSTSVLEMVAEQQLSPSHRSSRFT